MFSKFKVDKPRKERKTKNHENESGEKNLQLSCWDLTVWRNEGKEHEVDFNKMKSFCREVAKEWAFQLEEGEVNKTRHWQVRISLKVRAYKSALANLVNDKLQPGANISPTSTNAKLPQEAWYCIKPDSRIEGPWTSKDPLTEAELEEQKKKMQEDVLKNIEEWDIVGGKYMPTVYPSQQLVLDSFENYGNMETIMTDRRNVKVLYNLGGGIGKSEVARYLELMKIAICPDTNLDTEKMMGQVHQEHTMLAKGVILDCARCTKESMFDILQTAEKLKYNNFKDWRYGDRDAKKCAYPPVVWIFTNRMPPLDRLSADRWEVWVSSGVQDTPKMMTMKYNHKELMDMYFADHKTFLINKMQVEKGLKEAESAAKALVYGESRNNEQSRKMVEKAKVQLDLAKAREEMKIQMAVKKLEVLAETKNKIKTKNNKRKVDDVSNNNSNSNKNESRDNGSDDIERSDESSRHQVPSRGRFSNADSEDGDEEDGYESDFEIIHTSKRRKSSREAEEAESDGKDGTSSSG